MKGPPPKFLFRQRGSKENVLAPEVMYLAHLPLGATSVDCPPDCHPPRLESDIPKPSKDTLQASEGLSTLFPVSVENRK